VIGLLDDSGTSYAVIGGIAMQLYSQEPRTTLDIDVGVARYDAIPRDALTKAGFTHEGRYPPSDDWRAPGSEPRAQRTAVKLLSEEVGIEAAVTRARAVDVGGFELRLALPADLLVLKLAAAEEPRHRPRKRRQDLLDIITLVEEHPVVETVVPHLRQRVERLSSQLLTLGRTRGPRTVAANWRNQPSGFGFPARDLHEGGARVIVSSLGTAASAGAETARSREAGNRGNTTMPARSRQHRALLIR
jgi:hypothetical protein